METVSLKLLTKEKDVQNSKRTDTFRLYLGKFSYYLLTELQAVFLIQTNSSNAALLS